MKPDLSQIDFAPIARVLSRHGSDFKSGLSRTLVNSEALDFIELGDQSVANWMVEVVDTSINIIDVMIEMGILVPDQLPGMFAIKYDVTYDLR